MLREAAEEADAPSAAIAADSAADTDIPIAADTDTLTVAAMAIPTVADSAADTDILTAADTEAVDTDIPTVADSVADTDILIAVAMAIPIAADTDTPTVADTDTTTAVTRTKTLIPGSGQGFFCARNRKTDRLFPIL